MMVYVDNEKECIEFENIPNKWKVNNDGFYW